MTGLEMRLDQIMQVVQSASVLGKPLECYTCPELLHLVLVYFFS